MPKPIFPILREKAPLLDMFRQGAGATAAALTPGQKRMAEEFRIGLAEKLGLPPEAIRQEAVEKWIVNWSRAFTKPEHWSEQGYMRRLAADLVAMEGGVQAQTPEGMDRQEARMPPRGAPDEEERRRRAYRSESSDISIER